MYIIYVNHDSVIKQICQLRDKAFLINETGKMLALGRGRWAVSQKRKMIELKKEAQEERRK